MNDDQTHIVKALRALCTTPEQVFRAFLDGDATAKWLPPDGFTGKVHYYEAEISDERSRGGIRG